MRADRLISIMLLLQRRKRMTARDLAAALEVSRRTILRDVDALATAGIPIYAERGQGGGIMLDEHYRLSLIGLNEAEVRALFLASNAKLLADLGLREAAATSVSKLFAALPALQQHAVAHLRQRVYLDPTWWNEDAAPPVLPELFRAVNENRRVQVVYQHRAGDVVERMLEPYSLVAKSNVWYLVAVRDQAFRTYRVSRMHRMHVLDTQFERQPDFDVARYWRDQVQTYFESLLQYSFTLRVHERQLDVVRWYSMGRSQILEPADGDGWFTAQFEVEAMEQATMLVFGLGTDAQVIAPPALRATVLAQSQALLAAAQHQEHTARG